jgi:hypothetical protein
LFETIRRITRFNNMAIEFFPNFPRPIKLSFFR